MAAAGKLEQAWRSAHKELLGGEDGGYGTPEFDRALEYPLVWESSAPRAPAGSGGLQSGFDAVAEALGGTVERQFKIMISLQLRRGPERLSLRTVQSGKYNPRTLNLRVDRKPSLRMAIFETDDASRIMIERKVIQDNLDEFGHTLVALDEGRAIVDAVRRTLEA